MRNFILALIALIAVCDAALAQSFGGTGSTGGAGGSAGAGSSSGGFAGSFGQNNTGGGASTGTPGSTQSFSGNLDAPTAFGQTTGATGTGAGTQSGVPTQMNPFQAFYSNPQALGMQLVTLQSTGAGAANTQISAFGQPIFATATNTAAGVAGRTATAGLTGNTGNFGAATGGVNTGTLGGSFGVGGVNNLGGGFGGTGGAGGFGTATALSYGTPITFSTIGTTRAATYITSLGFTPPKAPAGKLQSDLQQLVARSSLLNSRNVQLAMDGNTVVLRGQVADDRERRLAEGIVRLSPGVRELRNELTVQNSQ